MDMILVKLFATALALSEVMTQPQAVKTQFNPVKDQDAVVQVLRDGCAHMRQAFDIESINVDDLITTALLSHGDTKHPLFFPCSPEECFSMSIEAFEFAEKGNLPTLMSRPAAFACASVKPTLPICGSQ